MYVSCCRNRRSVNREFKQIATAGADTAAGSKFPKNETLRMHAGCIQPQSRSQSPRAFWSAPRHGAQK